MSPLHFEKILISFNHCPSMQGESAISLAYFSQAQLPFSLYRLRSRTSLRREKKANLKIPLGFGIEEGMRREKSSHWQAGNPDGQREESVDSSDN
ncbi:hypothetical protein LINGRAHAP2_LOCUS15746 [Linum grandiflorum]